MVRRVRAAILALVAAAPLAWLLLPGLLSSAEIPGFASGRIYGRLHAVAAVGAGWTLGFPEGAAPPPPDATTRLLALCPFGAVAALKLWMLASAAVTLVVVGRYCRRELGPGWPAVAATAVATASPAVVAGLAGGEPEVLHGWALVALPLCSGWATIPVGAAIGLFAPALVPAALLPVILEARRRETARGPLVAGWIVAAAILALAGAPVVDGIPAPNAWFSAMHPAPAPERVPEVYVGYTVALAIVGAIATPRARPWGIVASVACAGALFQSTIGPERFLLLVPLAAAIGGLTVLGPRMPAVAVLAGTAWLGEGWKGEAVDLPLPLSPVLVPDPIAKVAEGPVLDLPASPGGAMRGLWFQTVHHQPIAVDAQGRMGPGLTPTVRSISAGECPDLAGLGFRGLIGRREAEFHELGALVKCYGDPDVDDGKVAVWTLTAPSGSAPPDPGR